MMTTGREKIITGLTENYVSYWTLTQAIKEAAQNIAYGVIKSGKDPIIEYNEETGWALLADEYTGFEKRHLYLGESEQRYDEEGLGNFGEGWKLFLLVMARNNIPHEVRTVGFKFWGELEETPHGTKVLVIQIQNGEGTEKGTEVRCQVPDVHFFNALNSFAVFAGIDKNYLTKDTIIPGRYGELWVNGVLIEKGDYTLDAHDYARNPLDLHFAYNLTDRSIMNRDRSQVDVSSAYLQISRIITEADVDFIREYVKCAMEGSRKQDIIRGFGICNLEQRERWRQILAELHEVDSPNKLVIASQHTDINTEAAYRGFKVLNVPSTWNDVLHYTGFKFAEEVVTDKPILNVIEPDEKQQAMLNKAADMAKKALGIEHFPTIKVADGIQIPQSTESAWGFWEKETQTIYIDAEALECEERAVRVLIHEGVHWLTGARDNTDAFTRGFEDAILRLLGYRVDTFHYGTINMNLESIGG